MDSSEDFEVKRFQNLRRESFPERIHPHRYIEAETSWDSSSDKVQYNCEPNDKDRSKCCGDKLCWYEFSEKSVNAGFFEDTSLHGLQYCGAPGLHILERFFWVIAFILSIMSAGYLIQAVWMKYVDSPVVVTFQPYETFIHEMPFPAVTICNMNKVLKSKAEEYIKNAMGDPNDENTEKARRNVKYLDHVCSTTKSLTKRFKYSSNRGTVEEKLALSVSRANDTDTQLNVALFLQQASQPCKDMIKLCLWQDEIFDCVSLFNPIETNFGKCCVFNQLPQSLLLSLRNDSRDTKEEIKDWTPWNDLLINGSMDGLLLTDFGSPFPRRQKRAGKTSGLSVVLNPGLNEYFCTSSDSFGYRLVTHLPIDVPHVTDFGIGIKPNTEVFTSIRPEITISDDNINNYDLEKRHCYTRDEYQLKYYTHYTSTNCFDECIANRTYETCKCVRYYMPRDMHRPLCGPDKYECAEGVKRSSFSSGMKEICKDCKPTCTELSYNSETTVSDLQPDLWTNENGSLAEWAESNVTIVHVFFGEDSTYAKVRQQTYGWTDLISNIGGLLGLCMGFSGLSVIEFLYYYTIRAWCAKRHRRAHRKKQERGSPYTSGMKSYSISYVKPKSTTRYESNVNANVNEGFVMTGESQFSTVESSKL